jgi:hypothetical protein
MKFQAVRGSAKAVGQDDVGTGGDKAPVKIHDLLRLLQIPQLGCIAGLQPGGE